MTERYLSNKDRALLAAMRLQPDVEFSSAMVADVMGVRVGAVGPYTERLRRRGLIHRRVVRHHVSVYSLTPYDIEAPETPANVAQPRRIYVSDEGTNTGWFPPVMRCVRPTAGTVRGAGQC